MTRSLLPENSHKLEILLEGINAKGRTKGLNINTEKMKLMVIKRNVIPPTNIKVDGNIMKKVEKLKYLGT